tara:strand:- start:91 stop:333 length:243 start_codon:yes stop_codon:yes gene_type:complete
MFEELDKHYRFLAEIASLKLRLMKFLRHGLGQEMSALQENANTIKISIDVFHWSKTKLDRAAHAERGYKRVGEVANGIRD